jgi:hypothetical protein
MHIRFLWRTPLFFGPGLEAKVGMTFLMIAGLWSQGRRFHETGTTPDNTHLPDPKELADNVGQNSIAGQH